MVESSLFHSPGPRTALRATALAKNSITSALVALRGGAISASLSISILVHAGLAGVAIHQAVSRGTVSAATTAARALEVPAPTLLPLLPDPMEPATPDIIRTPVVHRAPVHEALRREVTAPSVLDDEPAAQAELLATEAAPAPRFVMSVVATNRLGSGAVANAGHAVTAAAPSNAPLSERAADVPAKLMAGAPPAYTTAAQVAGVEADVPLEIVVDAAGSVLSARSLTHVGYGLDEAALVAVRSYRFTPALRGGQTVAVRMRWLMRFQLR